MPELTETAHDTFDRLAAQWHGASEARRRVMIRVIDHALDAWLDELAEG